MTKDLVRYRAAHAFQGDSNAHQISIAAGNIISVDATKKGGAGWVWGTLFGSARSGWCPESYLILLQKPSSVSTGPFNTTSTTTAPPLSVPSSFSSSSDGDPSTVIKDGFSGPIMGGSKDTHSNFRVSDPPVRQVSAKDKDTPNNPFAKSL